jgi:hypothetical protein
VPPLKPKVARSRRRILRAYFAAVGACIGCFAFGAPAYFTIPIAVLLLVFGYLSGVLYGLFGERRQIATLKSIEEAHYGAQR